MLTLQVQPQVADCDYRMTLSGSIGVLSHQQVVTLTVSDFVLSAAPGSRAVTRRPAAP